jgi:hypothetical protein
VCSPLRCSTASGAARLTGMSDVVDTPIAEQLTELGAQLDWVRDYL